MSTQTFKGAKIEEKPMEACAQSRVDLSQPAESGRLRKKPGAVWNITHGLCL
jgi:hypothetical protein